MSCPFSNNAFCSELSPQTRELLCAQCQLLRIESGQYIPTYMRASRVLILLEGLIVKLEMEDVSKKMVPSGMSCNASIICGSYQIDPQTYPADSRETLCVTPCHIASFDAAFMKRLFNENSEFQTAVHRNMFRMCSYEKQYMIRDIVHGTAYTAVRFMVTYCRNHKLPLLTHEQIAFICGLSRPTVTKTLHEITQKEPELFASRPEK